MGKVTSLDFLLNFWDHPGLDFFPFFPDPPLIFCPFFGPFLGILSFFRTLLGFLCLFRPSLHVMLIPPGYPGCHTSSTYGEQTISGIAQQGPRHEFESEGANNIESKEAHPWFAPTGENFVF